MATTRGERHEAFPPHPHGRGFEGAGGREPAPPGYRPRESAPHRAPPAGDYAGSDRTQRESAAGALNNLRHTSKVIRQGALRKGILLFRAGADRLPGWNRRISSPRTTLTNDV